MKARTLLDAVLVATGSVVLAVAATQVTGSMPLGFLAVVALVGAVALLQRRARQRSLVAARVVVAQRTALRRAADASVAPLTVSRRLRR